MSENDLESRLAALEAEAFTASDRELLRFVIAAVKAARGTIWLTNGLVKYVLPPLGVLWGLYHYGAEWVLWATGRQH
jgi:hypothetical protein